MHREERPLFVGMGSIEMRREDENLPAPSRAAERTRQQMVSKCVPFP